MVLNLIAPSFKLINNPLLINELLLLFRCIFSAGLEPNMPAIF